MVYADEAALRQRFGDEEVDAFAQRDPLSIERALSDADAEIDAYLGGRYQLPLSSNSAVLVRIACDIARYRLWAERASEEVRRRYEDARRFLEALAKGDVTLGLPEAQQPPKPMAMAAAKAGDAPIFTRAGTEGF